MCVQVVGDSSATFFDRQDGIALSMRDLKARLSHPRALDDKTGREGHDAFEEVTVEQPERNWVVVQFESSHLTIAMEAWKPASLKAMPPQSNIM
jgi:hypothetical protein